MAIIVLRGLTKRFTSSVAVDHVNLEVPDGKIVTLLGPSGCGKSTTLRMIAGFEQPDDGEILLDGRVINNLPPEHRPTSMVFQNYGLWPHKTVGDHIAFGLRVLKVPKDQIRLKIDEMLRLVNLEGLEGRYPRQLSGGQRQRVALARSLAVEPSILLLDEPLSNLDAKLRVLMRTEIKDLQRRVGITMIYVTHDQEEALSISDQIAVMNLGRIEQIGTPLEIYKHPTTEFVASFIGQSNRVRGIAEERTGERVFVRVGSCRLEATTRADLVAGQSVVLAIKAEEIQPTDSPGHNTLPASFHMPSYLGATTRWEIKAEGALLSVDVSGYRLPPSGEFYVHLPVDELIAFPAQATGGPRTMKAAVLREVRDLRLEDLPDPAPAANEVVIRVKACGLCATDIHMWKGTNTEGTFPFIPGHEWSGEIVQIGRGVEGFAVGDRVVGEVSIPCRVCRNCKDGMPPELCSAPRLYGFAWATPGGMAEYHVSDVGRLHKIPDNLSDEEAALVEPVSVGYHGVWTVGGGALPHDRIIVFGGGPIGLLTLLTCKAAGAWVGMVEPEPYRRQLAQKLGAELTVDPTEGHLEEQILDHTGGRGASLVVECSGNDNARAATLDVVANEGRIVFIGLGANRRLPVEIDKAIFKCATMAGSSGAGFDFAKTLAFMSRRTVDFRPVITPRLPLPQITQAFELGSRQSESGKIMILP